MEQYNGFLIGFCNEKKKRVLKGINEKLESNSNISIDKIKGFRGFDKEQIQQELKALIKQHNQVNTIYIVLKYDRIDNMRRKLQLIIDHFQNYLDHVCLIISNFQISQNRGLDQILIQTKLKDYYNIPLCVQYDIRTNLTDDNIYMDNKLIKFQDFIQKTLLKNNKKVTLISKQMNLEIIINQDILDELNRMVQNQIQVNKNRDYIEQKYQQEQKYQKEQNKKIQNNYYQQSNQYQEIKKSILDQACNQDRARAISQNNQQQIYNGSSQSNQNPKRNRIFDKLTEYQIINKIL